MFILFVQILIPPFQTDLCDLFYLLRTSITLYQNKKIILFSLRLILFNLSYMAGKTFIFRFCVVFSKIAYQPKTKSRSFSFVNTIDRAFLLRASLVLSHSHLFAIFFSIPIRRITQSLTNTTAQHSNIRSKSFVFWTCMKYILVDWMHLLINMTVLKSWTWIIRQKSFRFWNQVKINPVLPFSIYQSRLWLYWW